jgi:hypothetical protein
MGKFQRQTMLQAIAYLTCTVVLWVHLDGFGASEFSGGRLTGRYLKMAELGSELSAGAAIDILSSTNRGHNRPCSHTTLFSILPVRH